jgi:hypothetical protein
MVYAAAAGCTSATFSRFLDEAIDKSSCDQVEADGKWLSMAVMPAGHGPEAPDIEDPDRQRRILSLARSVLDDVQRFRSQTNEAIRKAALGRPQASTVPSFSKKKPAPP